jgi:hypothetical protein
MSLIRFRKRIQFDANNNLYARNPENPNEFIIVGNTGGSGSITAGTVLANTLRYRKAVRFDNVGDLFVSDGTNFVAVGKAAGFLPEAPVAGVVTAGNTQLSIAFTAGGDGGKAITNYEYSLDGGSNWVAFAPADTTSPVVITGLTNGEEYNVILRAVNITGSGPASNSVSGTPAE